MATINDNKQRALDLAVAQIDRQFGKGSIMRLGDERARVKVDVISTGCLSLNAAIGIGGIPRGRVSDLNPLVKPRWRCISLPRLRKPAAMLPLLMPNMPWIQLMPLS
jgi:hypothetical protein